MPFLALWGSKYLSISKPFAQFLTDAAAGTLPDVSFIDPRFTGESPQGVSADDHPQADIRNGQAFLSQIYNALTASPQWGKTLLIINYDEWGGFYDHVAPPMDIVSPQEFAATQNDGLLGLRVPCMAIGPRARSGYVDSTLFQPQSILNLITWRFGLDPVGPRALTANNFAHALDFSNLPRTDRPTISVPAGPFGMDCTTGLPVASAASPVHVAVNSYMDHQHEWFGVHELAQRHGFSNV